MFTLATTFNGPLNHLYQGQFLVLLSLYCILLSFSKFIVFPLSFVVTQISAFKRVNLAPAWTSVHSLFHSMYDFWRFMFFSSCIYMQFWYFVTIIVLTQCEKKPLGMKTLLYIIILSAWDRSRDSTTKRNLSKDI